MSTSNSHRAIVNAFRASRLCLVGNMLPRLPGLPAAERKVVQQRLGGAFKCGLIHLQEKGQDPRLLMQAVRDVLSGDAAVAGLPGQVVGNGGKHLASIVERVACADHVILWAVKGDLWMLQSVDAQPWRAGEVLKELHAHVVRTISTKLMQISRKSARKPVVKPVVDVFSTPLIPAGMSWADCADMDDAADAAAREA
jgi:hypothetical protein